MTHESPAHLLSPGEVLCTSCGLCCQSGLHNYAQLDDDEIDRATALGLSVDPESPGGSCFRLPCPRLEGTCCTIFSSRPRVCARYRCALLQGVEASVVRLETALETVATARQLADRIDALGIEGLSYAEARAFVAPDDNPAITRRAQGKVGAVPEIHNHLRLHATAFMIFIDRHFREREKRPTLTMAPVRPEEPLS